jgi:hypothetical protein
VAPAAGQQPVAAAAALRLPWLGPPLDHVLVAPAGGSQAGLNVGVLILLEGGRLILQELPLAAAAAAAAAATTAATPVDSETTAAAAAAAVAAVPESSTTLRGGQQQQQQQQQTHKVGPKSAAAPSTSAQPVEQQQQLLPPPVGLLEQQLQAQPLVTAARLRLLPDRPLPLQGLQVRSVHSVQHTNCAGFRV